MSTFADLLNGSVGTRFDYSNKVISENHDQGKINWASGLSDPGEMIRCGYLPEARRLEGESDSDYQARLVAMNLPEVLGPERFAKLLQAAQGRANLAMKDGKVCMFAAVKPGWHDLGVLISEAANSKEALRLASLADWDLQKIDQVIMWNEKIVPTGSYAIVRGDNGAVLTKGKSVGSKYKVVSNEELFEFMDEVVDGVDTRYDTAGAIGEGERVWLLAKMPGATTEVAKGDEVESYILLTASHDGSGAITCFQTSQRVVCQNTYRNALTGRNGKGCVIKHTMNVKGKIDAAREALGLAKRKALKFADDAKALSQTPMSDPSDFFNLVIDKAVGGEVMGEPVTGMMLKSDDLMKKIAAIPDREDREFAEVQVERIKTVRDGWLEGILERYDNARNNGMDSIKGTAWAAVNAVTEATQHGDLLRYKGSERTRRESRFESLIDGRAAEIADSAVQIAMSM